jgi:DNA-binding MarR family transcriptional regulator
MTRSDKQELVRAHPDATLHGQLFESDLLTNLSDLVNRWTSHQFQAAHAQRLAGDLDVTSNNVLYLLGVRGPSRPSDLAEQLATGRPNISKVIKRLVQDGLLVTREDPADSRATLIALTPDGERHSRDIFHIGDLMIRELTDGWSTGDVETFTRLVERLNTAAAAYEARISS